MSGPPRLLVIPDGLAERPGGPDGPPTSLDAIRPLALDALARRGAVGRVAVTPDGLHAGTETGLSVLMGWRPTGPVSRGRIEAAAHGIAVGAAATEAVHRIDVRHADGRPWPALSAAVGDRLTATNPDHVLHRLAGHRLLLIGDGAPTVPALGDLTPADADPGDAPYAKLWPDGVTPPRLLDPRTVVVCAPRSTAAGIATLVGAATVHPDGATGRPGTDVAAKARAAVAALRTGATTIVVHVGSPDEAAHDHDPTAKRLEAQRIDRDLIAPLAGLALDVGARIAVCPDHGTDPRSGRHLADPVPALLWGPGVAAAGPPQLRERLVVDVPVVTSPWDLA